MVSPLDVSETCQTNFDKPKNHFGGIRTGDHGPNEAEVVVAPGLDTRFNGCLRRRPVIRGSLFPVSAAKAASVAGSARRQIRRRLDGPLQRKVSVGMGPTADGFQSG